MCSSDLVFRRAALLLGQPLAGRGLVGGLALLLDLLLLGGLARGLDRKSVV